MISRTEAEQKAYKAKIRKELEEESRQKDIKRVEDAGIPVTEKEKQTKDALYFVDLFLGLRVYPPEECCDIMIPRVRRRVEKLEKEIQESEEKGWGGGIGSEKRFPGDWKDNLFLGMLRRGSLDQFERARKFLGDLMILCKTGDVVKAHKTESYDEIIGVLKKNIMLDQLGQKEIERDYQ